jgi:hypothetical protein
MLHHLSLTEILPTHQTLVATIETR